LRKCLEKQVKQPGDVTKILKRNKGRYKKISTYLKNGVTHLYDTRNFLTHTCKVTSPPTFDKLVKISKRYHDVIHVLKSKISGVTNEDVFKYKKLENLPEGYTQLLTEEDFINEGQKMQHCVGGYYRSFLSGNCFIFHVENNKSVSTVEICLNNERFSVRQNQGIRNTTQKTDVSSLLTFLNKELPIKQYNHKIEHRDTQRYDDEDLIKYFIKPFKLKSKLIINQS